jgi:hypothetical protein
MKATAPRRFLPRFNGARWLRVAAREAQTEGDSERG